MNNSHCN